MIGAKAAAGNRAALLEETAETASLFAGSRHSSSKPGEALPN